jgi:hypothetical protein
LKIDYDIRSFCFFFRSTHIVLRRQVCQNPKLKREIVTVKKNTTQTFNFCAYITQKKNVMIMNEKKNKSNPFPYANQFQSQDTPKKTPCCQT